MIFFYDQHFLQLLFLKCYDIFTIIFLFQHFTITFLGFFLHTVL